MEKRLGPELSCASDETQSLLINLYLLLRIKVILNLLSFNLFYFVHNACHAMFMDHCDLTSSELLRQLSSSVFFFPRKMCNMDLLI